MLLHFHRADTDGNHNDGDNDDDDSDDDDDDHHHHHIDDDKCSSTHVVSRDAASCINLAARIHKDTNYSTHYTTLQSGFTYISLLTLPAKYSIPSL